MITTKQKIRDGYSSSSPSPTRQIMCCFGCSSKRSSNENLKNIEWENNDEILTDLTTFSLKEQKKKLKKAMKEEEVANREAAKAMEWVKQASQRMMDISGIDDDLLFLAEDEQQNKKV